MSLNPVSVKETGLVFESEEKLPAQNGMIIENKELPHYPETKSEKEGNTMKNLIISFSVILSLMVLPYGFAGAGDRTGVTIREE